jgi:hypothetical protein
MATAMDMSFRIEEPAVTTGGSKKSAGFHQIDSRVDRVDMSIDLLKSIDKRFESAAWLRKLARCD